MADIKRSREYNFDVVDLGLSVKWADRNLGSKYLGTGNYLSFGSNQQDFHDGYLFARGNYKEPIGEYNRNTNGQRTIVLTSNDSAHNSDNNYRMPTFKEVEELAQSEDIEWFVAFRYVEKIPTDWETYKDPKIGFLYAKNGDIICRVYKEIRIFIGKDPFACELYKKENSHELHVKPCAINTKGGEVEYHKYIGEVEPFYLGACRRGKKNLFRYYCENQIGITENKWYDNILIIPFSGVMKYNTERKTNTINRGIVKNGKQTWNACFPCGSLDHEYAFYNIAIFNFRMSYEGFTFKFDTRPHIAFSNTPWDGMNVRAVENVPNRPPRY